MSQDPATRSLLLAMYRSRQAGLDVELVPATDELKYGFLTELFRASNKLVSVHRLTNTRALKSGRQVYARTSLQYSAVRDETFFCYHVIVPCYRQYQCIIPSANLRTEFFPGETYSEDAEVSLYFPLVYRPENPRFDFLAYEDRWDLIRKPKAARRQVA